MECCKKRAINNPCFIGVEKRLADGRRAMNTTHIMNLRIGLGRSDRYEKTESEKYLKALFGGTISKVFTTRLLLRSGHREVYGLPIYHSFCEEGHPLGMRVTPLSAGPLH
jgi:hypothetical protein